MRRLSTSHGAGEWAGYVAGWPVAVARLTALARRLHVDVVHSNSLHSWYGWAAARARSVSRTWCTHARSSCSRGAALRVERALCRHFATRVIAVSYAVAAQLDPANVVVLDEYLDPDEFSPARAGAFRARVGDPRRRAARSARSRRLDPLKGLDVLLDALRDRHARQRPDLQLVIVGSPVLGQDALRRRPARPHGRHARRPAPRVARRHPRRHGRSRRARVPVGGAGVVRARAGRGAGQRHPGGGHRPRRPARDRGPGHAGHRPRSCPRAMPTRWPPRCSTLLPAADVTGTPSGPPARASHRRPPRFAELFRAVARSTPAASRRPSTRA